METLSTPIRRRLPRWTRLQGWSSRRERRRLLGELAQRRDLRLNFGSGQLQLAGWINCDIHDYEDLTLRMDATDAWPFPNQSAVAVNSEHMIEHCTRGGVPDYLREAFRVLRPGGVIRTSTPDLAGICRAYLGDGPELDQHRVLHGYDAATRAQMVNNYFYSWDHRQLYDYETLALLLREAGFEQIERAKYCQSRHGVLRGIDRHDPDPLFTFVFAVDAVKPKGGSIRGAARP